MSGGYQNVRVIDPTTEEPYGGSGAPPGVPTADALTTPLGHQSVTVTNTATTLAALLSAATATAKTAIPAATRTIWFQPAGDVRFAAGGDTPNTATDASRVGDNIIADQWVPLTMSVALLGAIKFVAASNTIMAVRFEG